MIKVSLLKRDSTKGGQKNDKIKKGDQHIIDPTKADMKSKKPAKADRKILYLDFYPPITVNGKQTRREYLGLFIYDKPRTPFDREHNTETMKTAEMRRLNRYNELNKPEIYTPFEREQLRLKEIGEGSFSDYLRKIVNKQQYNTHDTIVSVEKHINKFAGKSLIFSDITEKLCNGFKEYLLTAINFKTKAPITQNTASLYFTKFKTILRGAYKDGHLPIYLNDKLGSIKPDETRRNYLSLDELNKLVQAPCAEPVLKRAALFSALTGLRFSDIEKLTWDEVEGQCLKFTQRKTGGIETLPISQQAAKLLGDRDQARPFEGLQYGANKNILLKNWITSAGITKKITFHCFRHTYATLQLSSGTDIYTVSKMLGHRDLKTTQIYAKVIDKAKQDATERITLKF